MTNHWIDIQNSDCILIQGSNAAENHPISFKWVMRAKDKGATLIHVDPRFTRTSAKADIYAPLRSGSDIAFLGGMINYIIEKDKYFKEYVVEYTNASFLVSKDYGFNDGLFSGFDPKTRKYDKSSWAFQLGKDGAPLQDKSLKDKNCVFQIMKKHYSRYDLKTVSAITGTPEADLIKVFEAFAATGKKDKAGTIMYALGQTQHTIAVQNIRTMAMVQLLLGNVGIAGGGINALRGEPNVQGSTDHAILYHYLPGYLTVPRASYQTLEHYNKVIAPTTHMPKSVNWQGNYPKYAVSLMRAFFGDHGSPENGWGYDWLPKCEDGVDYSVMTIFDKMYHNKMKGFIGVGQNPACSVPNSGKVRRALQNLEWMVHINIFDNETASFWKGPGVDPTKVATECFLLPAAAAIEKEGSQSNSGRWQQWKYETTPAPGEARYAGEIFWMFMDRLAAMYEKDGGALPEAVKYMNRDFVDEKKHYDAQRIARTINGYFLKDVTVGGVEYKKGELVPGFSLLQADGSTSSGNWLCCGSFTRDGKNLMERRGKNDPSGIGLFSEWSWCWPVNRRIIYNRASVDLKGQPFNPKKAVIQWKDGKWVGDVPDGPWPPMGEKDGVLPFIMKPDGLGSFFGQSLVDGPLPEHYEPLEGPFAKSILSSQLISPTINPFNSDMDIHVNASPDFPLVMTTYSCTEHWCTGGFTRWQPWLTEAMPQSYVEISEELAAERGIANGDPIVVKSPRGQVKSVAMVTPRLRPLQCGEKLVNIVGMTYNYGWLFPEDCGDTANYLTPAVGDGNSMTPEYKAFMVNIEKA